jgi:glycosyltransferase involved in cell wall biosynthesis
LAAGGLPGYRGTPVSDLARALVRQGIQTEIVTGAEEVEATTEFCGEGFRLIVTPRRSRIRDRGRDFFAAERRHMKRALEGTDASVLHAMWTYEFALAAQGDDRPVVVTAHDAPWTIVRYSPDPYRIARALIATRVRFHLASLVTVSPYLADKWRGQMAYRRELSVIPNVVEISGIARRDENDRRARGGGLRILEVADGSARKNVSTLIEAVQLIRRRGADVTLDLVGPGLDPASALAESTRKRGFEGVKFHGIVPRTELGSFLSAADVFVHASREESFGMSVAEAMAFGVPVVGGRASGAIPWLLDGGAAGALVDVTRADALAEEIVDVLQNRALASERALIARERVVGMASEDAVVARYLSEYEAAAIRHSSRSGMNRSVMS